MGGTHRTWQGHANLNGDARPPTPLTTPWTNRTFDKIYCAPIIDIIILTAQQYEEQAFSWTIATEQHILMTDQARLPTRLYAGKNRSLLAGIIHATTSLHNEYYKRNAPIHNTVLNIWIKCGKTIRACNRYNHRFHTASTAIQSEDELFRHANTQLAYWPSTQFRKITTDCHNPTRQHIQDTMIHPDQISEIETVYKTPTPRASLILNGHIITTNPTELMRIAYSSQTYRTHLQDKYSWDDQTIESIDWHLMEQALTKIKGKQKDTIKQIIHGWLPTNAHPGRHHSTTATTCPNCTDIEETNTHFLWCPADQTTWLQWITDILHPLATPAIAPLHQLLTLALTQQHSDQAITELSESLPLTFLTLTHEQTLIGWNQILFGRWSKRWVTAHDTATGTTTGTKWAVHIISSLWKKLIEKWHTRCHREHNTTPTRLARDTNQLDQQIQSMYTATAGIDVIDKQAFTTPIEEILQLPHKTKRAWVSRMGPHLKASIQRAKRRLHLRTQAITNFFLQRAPHQERSLSRPRNARAHAEDFDPP